RHERGPKQIRARQANLTRLGDELTKLQTDHKAARVRSDQKQLLLKSGEDKIESLKVKLNAAPSTTEDEALKDQIPADQIAGSVLADEILEVMEKIDELAGQLTEQQQKINQAKDELSKAEQAVRDEAGLVDGDIKRLEAELAKAEGQLPADFRANYQ